VRTILSFPKAPSGVVGVVAHGESSAIRRAPPAFERLIAGKYRVDRVIGHGGSGIVVAATHVQLDQRVAIKTMLRPAIGNRDARERFAREARAAARIQSDHVARIYDVGEDEDGLPYIVMEYFEGCDLWDVLEERGALPVAEAIQYALEICDALERAHAVGIVHRDLKPANVFLAKRPGGVATVKVLDFGMSKLDARLLGRPLTDPRMVMGTPGWMSPEQLLSTRDVDARSDIWNFGALLFNLLTGRPVYARDAGERQFASALLPPDPPSRYVWGISSRLDAIVMRCMKRDACERYQSIRELATALAEFAAPASRELVERVVGEGFVGASSENASVEPALSGSSCVRSAPSVRPAKRTTPTRRRPRALLVAAATLLGGTFALTMWLTSPITAGQGPASSAPIASLRSHHAALAQASYITGGSANVGALVATPVVPPELPRAPTRGAPAPPAGKPAEATPRSPTASDSSDPGPARSPLVHPEFGDRL
jgi:serine/threonine protein kinase